MGETKHCPRCGRPIPEYAVSCECGFSYADPKSNTPYHPEEEESKHIKKGEFGIQVKQLLLCLGLLAIPSAIQVALSNTGLILGAIPVVLLYTPSLALIMSMKKGKWGPQFKEKKTTGLDKPVNIVPEHSQAEKVMPEESKHQPGVELLEQLRDENDDVDTPLQTSDAELLPRKDIDLKLKYQKMLFLALIVLICMLFLIGAFFYGNIKYNAGYEVGYSEGYEAGVTITKRKYANSSGTQVTVYVDPSGNKYHEKGCLYLSNDAITISLKDATDSGYAPCTECNPPELGTSRSQ